MKPLEQRLIPAARHVKDLESAINMGYKNVVMLQIPLSQAKPVRNLAHQHGVQIFFHADLIQGLKPDEFGAQFLCHEVKPDGLISTHPQVVSTAMKRGLIGIQRIFLIDSHSLETSYRVVQTLKPDYLEVLPGIVPSLIREVSLATDRPLLAGGFIRSKQQVQEVIDAGAQGITTSDRSLWSQFV